MRKVNSMSVVCPPTPKFSLASAVQNIVLAASVGVGLMSLGAGPVHAATNVAIKDFQGAWSSTASYTAGAVVTYDNASYIALRTSAAVAPGSNAADWTELDAPGPTGAKGATGATGPAGISHGVTGIGSNYSGITLSRSTDGMIIATTGTVSVSGVYYISATPQLGVVAGDFVFCYVAPGAYGYTNDGSDAFLTATSAEDVIASVAVNDVWYVNQGDVVNLICNSQNVNSVVYPTYLTAILIDKSNGAFSSVNPESDINRNKVAMTNSQILALRAAHR